MKNGICEQFVSHTRHVSNKLLQTFPPLFYQSVTTIFFYFLRNCADLQNKAFKTQQSAKFKNIVAEERLW